MSHEAVSDDLHDALERKNHKKYILYFFLKHSERKCDMSRRRSVRASSSDIVDREQIAEEALVHSKVKFTRSKVKRVVRCFLSRLTATRRISR